MDTDLEAMRSIGRYSSCVECLLEPLLQQRRLWQMPCRHRETVERKKAARIQHCKAQGYDDPGDDESDEMPEGYCDCRPFNPRIALWEIGDLCVKYGLSRRQMRELAAIVCLVTKDTFTYNHVKRAMHDMFAGRHEDYLKAFKIKREEGIAFAEAMTGLVPEWQFRMMPNV